MPFGLVPKRQIVGHALGDRTAADASEHLLAGQFVKIAADRCGRHAEFLSCTLDLDLALGGEQFEQLIPAPVPAHVQLPESRPISRHTSVAIASRPAATYRRGSVTLMSPARRLRTAAVNTLLSCVAILILVRPARTASCSAWSGTPDDPCSTSGTATAA